MSKTQIAYRIGAILVIWGLIPNWIHATIVAAFTGFLLFEDTNQ